MPVVAISASVLLLAACGAVLPSPLARQLKAEDAAQAAAVFATDDRGAEQLVELLPPDAIRAIDDPKFISAAEADSELSTDERVLGVSIEGDARAYPLSILSSHEIVNDNVGNEPVAITWCPLCFSALVFSRQLDGRSQPLTFGVSGKLLRDTLVMFDRETDTLWSQLYGAAIEGPLTGTSLAFFPATVTEWSTWRRQFPHSRVLSKKHTRLQFNRGDYATAPRTSYAIDPYAGYYVSPQEGVTNYRMPRDESSLQPKKRVIGVRIGQSARAYPFALLEEKPVINDRMGDANLLVWFEVGSGAGYAYERRVGNRVLTFAPAPGEELRLVDHETGSLWDPFLGVAVTGPLQGETLVPVIASPAFEFGWYGNFPESDTFQLNAHDP